MQPIIYVGRVSDSLLARSNLNYTTLLAPNEFFQMTQAIEEAVKALAEFESELDRIKSDASEAKKRLVKTAADEAEKAKSDAVTKAQQMADEGVKVAKQEAERETAEIAKKGEESLNRLKAATLKRKEEAVELAVRRLLGG